MTRAEDKLTEERKWIASGVICLVGIDEAGRGPLAGPVIAAAVMLPLVWLKEGMPKEFGAMNDSKQLTSTQRDHFYLLLTSSTEIRYAVGRVDASEIDRINILQATYEAMRLAIKNLGAPIGHALVDGLPVPRLGVPHSALVKGDSRSYSIAAASVVAKVVRDREMLEAESHWPGYGFARHKGYGTEDHLAALKRLGPCPIHRRTFAPLRPRDPEPAELPLNLS